MTVEARRLAKTSDAKDFEFPVDNWFTIGYAYDPLRSSMTNPHAGSNTGKLTVSLTEVANNYAQTLLASSAALILATSSYLY